MLVESVSSIVPKGFVQILDLILPTPSEEDTSSTLFYRGGPEMLSNSRVMSQLVGDKTGSHTWTVGFQCYPCYTRYKLPHIQTYIIYSLLCCLKSINVDYYLMHTNLLKQTEHTFISLS